MEQHFKILGWLFVILAVLSVLSWLAVAPAMRRVIETMATMPNTTPQGDYQMPGQLAPEAPPLETLTKVTAGFMNGMLVFGLIYSVIVALTGLGMVGRKGWARVPAIIVSILALPGIPVGTALGIYGLWAMLSSSGSQAWQAYTSV